MKNEISTGFNSAIAMVKDALLEDGRIDLAETAFLLRLVKPAALRGVPEAVALQKLLEEVREDGIITAEESGKVVEALQRIADISTQSLENYVRVIPDFPKPGVLFRDVTGILDTAEGFTMALNEMVKALDGVTFDVVAAPESRGFIFGAALAGRLGKAFVPVRKPGKLPRSTISEDYDLEYGKATLHIHSDAVIPGERVVIVDDLLATGGTAAACARLVEKLGASVATMLFPIELEGFEARSHALRDYKVVSLVRYSGK